MTAATRLIWALAGAPQPVASTSAHLKEHPATCAICAEQADLTADFDKALGANFTDRSLIKVPSGRVCPACLWCCSGKPPATLRMWSVVAGSTHPSHPKAWLQETPGLCLTNRADTKPVVEALTNPPSDDWCVTVALSGQKHVVPYATVNPGGADWWTVRLEDRSVTATVEEWRHVHRHTTALRKMGIPADAIQAGEPKYIKTAEQLATWKHHDQQIATWRTSQLLSLALWTITKDMMK